MLLLLLACLLSCTAGDVPLLEEIEQPTGDHVCQKNMTVMVNATEEIQKEEKYTDNAFCFDFSKGFRCAVEKTRMVTTIHPITLESVEEVDVCCPGYTMSANSTCEDALTMDDRYGNHTSSSSCLGLLGGMAIAFFRMSL